VLSARSVAYNGTLLTLKKQYKNGKFDGMVLIAGEGFPRRGFCCKQIHSAGFGKQKLWVGLLQAT
jgi:hypothetical protein